MSVSIDIDKVVKKYGDTVVVNGLSVDIMPGEFFTLLGPSGCGKTTLLRMIIGFNSIEGGTISVDGNVINDVATDKRNMGMVFQNYAIFPHMSVKDNVAFGLRMRKVPEKEIEERVDKILKIVKIDHLKDRMPTALSGGQQQRVALARVQSGRETPYRNEECHQADPAPGGYNHGVCHPRPGRGAGGVRPYRRHEWRGYLSDRQTGGYL